MSKNEEQRAGERIVLYINGIDYAFRWCPSGKFIMGSPEDEEWRLADETQHQVTLSRGFWMLETQVTQGMWENVMGNDPSYFKWSRNFPVESVSWNDCQEFITKLNTLLAGTPAAPVGYKFSLPTEAQWEYACRAGTTTAYHFGNSLNAEQAHFDVYTRFLDDDFSDRIKEVGSYPANAWGLYDMHGNVWEWCLDKYGEYPSGAVTDPTGASYGSGRVNRGGSWDFDDADCRSACRDGCDPTSRSENLGFRLSLVRAE